MIMRSEQAAKERLEVRLEPLQPSYIMGHILVVDDEAPIRSLLSDLIEELGYEVNEASTGLEALSIIASKGKPDLVITDLMMPIMNGEELLMALRNNQTLADVPVVIMTAAVQRSIHIQSPRPPIILKPFTLDQVEELLERYLPHQAA